MTTWLDSIADAGLSAKSDLLASHATRALDLARAAGLEADVPDLETSAVRYLVMAGDRQQSLDAARAAGYYRQALALAPPGLERAEIRRTATGLGWRSGGMTSDAALEEYRTAEREAMEAGDHRLAARVLRRIYFQLGLRGETAAAHAALEQAIALVADDPGAREVLSELYACRSEAEMFAGRSDESLRWAELALELPRTETVTLMALHLRGNARCEAGDLGGVDDLRKALEIAEASGVAIDIVTSYSYLLEWVGLEDGPATGLPMNRATVDLCLRRGIEGQGMWTRAEGLWLRFDAGLWDELLDETSGLADWAAAHGDTQIATVSDLYRARVLAHRGERGGGGRARRFLRAGRSPDRGSAGARRLRSSSRSSRTPPPATRSGRSPSPRSSTPRPAPGRRSTASCTCRRSSARCCRRADPIWRASIVGDRPVHVRRTRLAVASSQALLAEARGDARGGRRELP